MLQSTKLTFRILCFILAINLTVEQMQRYIENNDTSVMSYKHFNSNENKYPIFTFCFASDPNILYNDELKELYPLKNPKNDQSKENYNKILKGFSSPLANQTDIWEKIRSIEIRKLTHLLHTFIHMVNFNSKSKTKSRKYDRTLNESKNLVELRQFLYLSHQDPDQICFSRQTESTDDSDLLRKTDEVWIDLNPIIDSTTANKYNGYFRTYMHYPGQLIRNLDKPAYEITIEEFIGVTKLKVSVTVSFVSVLRKRPSANKKCNASLTDDDTEFRLKIVQRIGCIPIYWIGIVEDEDDLKPCKSVDNHQNIYSLIKNSSLVMNSYNQPCIEMMVPINLIEDRNPYLLPGYLILTIPYATEMFQEIQNVNDFDIQSLWSSVGGFVGIFLGYSLLQIPELFDVEWKSYCKKFIFTFLTKVVAALMVIFYKGGKIKH